MLQNTESTQAHLTPPINNTLVLKLLENTKVYQN